jgi:DNA-binding transcriptional ArsR family regulator
MAKQKFLLISLKEEDSKKLAQTLSNDTSRKILDYLAEKEGTETELAEKLQIPISTVHYNLQALSHAKLVEADEFHYSEKGKEVLHYKLANKYIIIAPKSTFGIKEKLKTLLPVALIGFFGSGIFLILQQMQKNVFSSAAKASIMREVGVNAVQEAAAYDAAPKLAATAGAAPQTIQQTIPFWQAFLQNPALWFLFGCVFTIILIMIIEYINYRKNK